MPTDESLSQGGNTASGSQGDSANLEAAINSIIAKNSGDTGKAIHSLLQENYGYREKIRTLKERVDALQGNVPKENEVVVSSEVFEQYKGFGTPEEVGEKLSSLTEISKRYEALNASLTVQRAAAKNGFKPDVFEKLLKADNAQLKEEGEDYIIVIGDTDHKLDEYVEKQWAEFEPVLRGGKTFVKQGSAKSAPKHNDLVRDFLERQNKRASVNPFNT